jgi:hypothetical protein
MTNIDNQWHYDKKLHLFSDLTTSFSDNSSLFAWNLVWEIFRELDNQLDTQMRRQLIRQFENQNHEEKRLKEV